MTQEQVQVLLEEQNQKYLKLMQEQQREFEVQMMKKQQINAQKEINDMSYGKHQSNSF